MASRSFPIPAERIKMDKAMSITGKAARALQGMAQRGKIPGAKKIGGEWTFNEAALRAWVDEPGGAPCRDEKPRATRSGAATSFGVAQSSKAATSNGLLEQTIQRLRAHGSRANVRG